MAKDPLDLEESMMLDRLSKELPGHYDVFGK